MAASIHPLASETGVAILRRGGNAFDAAVAMAALLNVVDPHMTGIGGDAFMLTYHAAGGKVEALNASGRSPYDCSLEYYAGLGWQQIPVTGIHAVSTPGALDGWLRLLERHGSMALADLLEPAIRAAFDGFVVNRYLAGWYRHPLFGMSRWARFPATAATYLTDGQPPEAGQRLRQPALAGTLQRLARHGARDFYEGELAERIERFCRQQGGFLTRRDLRDHQSDWVEPISTIYRGYTIYEFPPNTQGIALLEQLNILEGFDLAALGPNSAEAIHLQIEAKKLAFADLERYITDPDAAAIPVAGLLAKAYAARQRETIRRDQAAASTPRLDPALSTLENTTYFCVVDAQRNAVSFINSLRSPWGCGLVAADTGILLQNRGKDFSLNPRHVNRLAPHKRTFHTLNPAMVLRDGQLVLVLGCAGAEQQTQALQQLLVNVIDFGMEPQEAIAAPRWSSASGLEIGLEAGIEAQARGRLAAKGHRLVETISTFGQAQMIAVEAQGGGLRGGTESRAEGLVAGY
ncbi:MAG: gamma-glutamyltransferase [Candidatus Tectomicrobia bacterium]|nr:gamma-glutamyltransferase [Candidatus Tectomicrobia bacterium]